MASHYRVENLLEALWVENQLRPTFYIDAILTWFKNDVEAQGNLGLVLNGEEDVSVFDYDVSKAIGDHAVRMKENGVDVPHIDHARARSALAYRVGFFKRSGGLNYNERFLRFLALYPVTRPTDRSQELAKLLSESRRLKKRLCEAVESGDNVDGLLDEVDIMIRMYGKYSVINSATSPGTRRAVRSLRSLISKYRQVYGIEEKV